MCPENLWWQNEVKYSGTDTPVRLFKSVNILKTDTVLIISVWIWLLTHTQSRIYGCTRPWLMKGYDPIGVSGLNQQIVALGLRYWTWNVFWQHIQIEQGYWTHGPLGNGSHRNTFTLKQLQQVGGLHIKLSMTDINEITKTEKKKHWLRSKAKHSSLLMPPTIPYWLTSFHEPCPGTAVYSGQPWCQVISRPWRKRWLLKH